MACEPAGEEKVGDCEELREDACSGGKLGAAGGWTGVGVVDHRDTAAERAVEGQHSLHDQPGKAPSRHRQNPQPGPSEATAPPQPAAPSTPQPAPTGDLFGPVVTRVTSAGRML